MLIGAGADLREVNLVSSGYRRVPKFICVCAHNPDSDTSLKVDRDTAATLLFAGHDTTANLITWFVFEMCRNPNLQRRVQEDVRVSNHLDNQKHACVYIVCVGVLVHAYKNLETRLRLHSMCWRFVSCL